MRIRFKQNYSDFTLRHSSGSVLLDVLLAIVIFVIGMLALASLQGNLTRSSSDANARTVGTNVAEELIEEFRTFRSLRTANGVPAYQQIVDQTISVLDRGGIDYTVVVTVDDWYFKSDLVNSISITNDTSELPSGQDTTISDFKYLELAVSWEGNEFQIGDETTTSDRLGSGAFVVSSIVPSIPQLGAAKVAADDDDALGVPPINYTPGARPDIVAINLTDERFKESTTPLPDVIRRDELVETWFDVVTYNTANNNAVFLRREEFVVLTCECTLHTNGGSDETGFLPTIWNGVEYITGNDGEMVAKNYGTSANNQQSQYCDTCCRDHHDAGGNNKDNVYDPARLDSRPNWSVSGGQNGDHEHYTRAGGGLNVTNNNGKYVESCRMVRKDGFMRVAQDFRQEALISFPEGYLDTLGGVEEYSEYVTSSVTDFYVEGRDVLTPPSGDFVGPPAGTVGTPFPFDFPGDATDDATWLPLMGLNSQQMRSRGIYIDNLGSELTLFLNCLAGTVTTNCPVIPPGVNDPLQVLPFYDIQTTWLAWWISDPAGDPVSVTSESVSDNNSHSRGLAVLENPAATGQQIDIDTTMHRGNIGLTVTDPITRSEDKNDSNYVPEVEAMHMLYLDVNGGVDGEPPTPTGYTWSGTFSSSVNQVDASSATIQPGGNAFCSRSGTAISCVTPNGEGGSLTITGYVRKVGQDYLDYWICSSDPALQVANLPAGINNSATVTWNAGTVVNDVVLSIEASICP